MLAITTTQSLTLAEPSTIKRSPPSVPPTSSLTSPTSSTWSADNSALFVSSPTAISQFDTSGGLIKTVWSSSDNEPSPVAGLVSKDRGSTLIFSRGQQVHLLETHTGKLSQTFDTHNAPIVALALSNDGTLLASASARAAHVHNLSHGSHTVLRGLPAGAGSLTACAFHPHSRTRLLLAVGTQLLVYDTTRPSGPIKTIPLEKEKGIAGEVVAITSSPFSKTLVAIACSGGIISLVDLDKEKGLFRTLSLHVPLTSLVFSPEGATLYAGTENGKLFVQDLRSLDKPPKSITVSSTGDRVVSISVQKKHKPEDTSAKGATTTTTTSTGSTRPLVQQDVNKKPVRTATAAAEKKPATAVQKTKTGAGGSPVSPRVASGVTAATKARTVSAGAPRAPRARTGSSTSAISPARVAKSGAGGNAERSPTARKVSSGGVAKKRVFSPPKSPLKRTTVASDGEEVGAALDVSVRIESLLALPRGAKKENLDPTSPAAISSASSATSRAASRARTRTASSTRSASTISGLRPESTAAMSVSTAVRASKSSAGPGSISPVPPVPSLPSAISRHTNSRTPSPDLPEPDVHAPVTPVPLGKKGKDRMGVLGLGTPEVERWIRAGEGLDGAAPRDGKRVGFAGDADEQVVPEGETSGHHKGPALAMQVSPRRLPPRTGASSWAPVLSPLRNPAAQPHPASPRAQDLLQTLLRDALYDFRQETHSEIVGLHLDLVRMGRGWRREMREAMEEFGGELKALREENARLREENEHLRRGY
ncbi:YVTN repeat-like/Quino protein amine dehydrogenase [Amylocystis lapponica]|nr:YVTN repeat-like/Quino protein amine dehydrogenase [Amylocystis lapponica]